MIYIQKDDIENRPHHFDCACAMYGAIDSGKRYKLVSYDEVASGKWDMIIPNNLFVGSVEFMREVFSRRGLINVRLPQNSNRREEIITLGEALDREKSGERLFVKPYDIKLFSGTILDGVINSQITQLPSDTKVIACEPFEDKISTEWRCYVHKNNLYDGHQYSGEPLETTPYYGYIEDIIEINKLTFPVAYTIDIAILKNGSMTVVEYNDMWAIGNYGMENTMYLRMLSERYFEIINKK